MSDHKSSIPGSTLATIIVVCALVSSFFGFFSGLVAGNPELRKQMLSAVSPGLGSMVKAPAAPAASGQPNVVQQPATTEEDKTVKVVENASPAVVSIVISKDVPVYEQYYQNPFPNNDFFQQFFGNNPQMGVPQYRQNGTQHKEIGAGSGFLVSPDGYIVTNKHVVSEDGADYTVILQDGRKYPGKVLALDPSNDVAVVKIEKDPKEADFPHIPWGDSSKLKVGQSVLAIGNALGEFGNTVSSGIISGLKRRIQAGDGMTMTEDLYDLIQTDAAINPGNSGGPLLNLHGEVVGVNVAMAEGSENIGFSLPINDIRKTVESVQKGGKITRAFLGVRYVMITKDIQQQNQLTVDYGALVVRGDDKTQLAVSPGSPADIAGIVENDIILEADGQKLTEDYPLFVAIARKNPGDKITFKVLHKGQEKSVDVTLAEKK